jgi:FtsP/CotA-like multicopper oxidase with cupredoxin domain
VNVLPGGKVSWDFTAIGGDWAFHCHLFLHMAMGMMRVVQVRPVAGAGA